MGRFLQFVLILILVLSLFPLYTRYKAAAAPIPPGVHLGGVELSHLKDEGEIVVFLQQRYRDPIAVYFDTQRLVLRPQEIGFQLDGAAMLREAGQYLEGTDFIDIALRNLLGLEQKRRDVPIQFTYDLSRLDSWLARVAVEQNRSPQTARAIPPQWGWSEGSEQALPPTFVGSVQQDWSWTLGTPGLTLRPAESVAPILAALTNVDDRNAHLVLDILDPPALAIDDLSHVLNGFTSDFPGFAAIYVQDLTTGEEATVDVDVAFSGMSTMKIAIIAETFRQMEGVANAEVGQLIDYALGESSNFAANQLLRRAGGGDIYAGGQQVTGFLRQLGLANSFIQTGYDDPSPVADIATAANQQSDWNTNPDAHLQSTPRDMGRLLSSIYYCANGSGPLLEVFGSAFTADECRAILFYMSHDEFQELLWAGLPRPMEAWIVHKHGFVNEAHSDVALVWGPTGPYVIAVYLWRSGWMDWETSSGTMSEISRIVWNYFAFKQQLDASEPGPPLMLEPPPNYVAVNTYSSLAATGGGDTDVQ